MKADARGTNVRQVSVERKHCLAQAEVACGPGLRTRQVPGEEPVRAPLAQAAQGRQPRLDLGIGKSRKLLEVELCPGEPEDILRLPPREAKRGQLLLRCTRHSLARRKRDGVLGGNAEALGETAPHGERRVK